MQKKRSFKKTTKALFLKYTVIPILIIILLFSTFTFVIFKLKIIYDANQSAKGIEQKITTVYKNYYEEINRMATLSVIKENMNSHRKNHLIYEEFYNFNNQQSVKSAFYLIDKRDIFVASTSESNSEINDNILEYIVPRIKENPDDILIDVDKTNFSHNKTSVVTIGKAIKNDKQVIGFLVYKLYEEDFQHLVFGEKADITVVTDSYNHIVVATNDIVKGLMNKFVPEEISGSHVKIKDEKYHMKKVTTKDDLFTIYTLINIKDDYTFLILYIFFLLITCGLLYLLVIILSEKMSTKNVQSIDKLLTSVSQLEKGDMKSYVDINTGDEFELLANEYNKMLDNLNDLMKRNKELSEIRKVDEIKLLQSQFNPHFLFNVLETLRYTMVIDIEKAQGIILSLSNLLRYSINDKMKVVSIGNDLNYIIDYLKLHKIRFSSRLHYDIKVDKKLQQAYIPKLLLQPIIENAIKYGYRNQTVLNINIQAEVIGADILFTIIDNGDGIDKETLHNIQKSLQSKKSNKMGIGLYNVHRRLVLLYGEGFGLSIKSTPGSGTKVEIKIPFNKGGG